MTIKSSGTLSFSEINTEYQGGGAYSLSQYYRGGGLVPNIAKNASISTGGEIDFNMFYGTQRWVPAGTHGYQVWNTPGAGSFTLPLETTNIRVVIIGGGASGTQGGFDGGDNGVGGRPGDYLDLTFDISDTVLNFNIGAGGQNIESGSVGSPTSITIPGYGTYTAAGGYQLVANNAPGYGNGRYYCCGPGCVSADPNVANSYYTTLFGVHTGGYTIDANVPNWYGSAGTFGGGGGGGCGWHGLGTDIPVIEGVTGQHVTSTDGEGGSVTVWQWNVGRSGVGVGWGGVGGNGVVIIWY